MFVFVFSILLFGAAAAAGLVYQAIGSARDRRAFPPPGHIATIGALRLHYRCEGAGSPAVILEAGIAASSVSWSHVQPAVARFTRVCSYDRAGLAWSGSATTRRSLPAMIDELRALLSQADVPPPYVLVGHSFGGVLLRAFTRAFPHDVAGLVFVDPLHPEEWCDPSPQQRQLLRGGVFLSRVGAVLAQFGVVRLCLSLLSGGAPSAPRRFSRIFGPTAAALLEHIVGEVQKLPPEVLPAVQAHWSNPRAFRGMAQHLAALPESCALVAAGNDVFDAIPVVVLSAVARDARWLAADAALARMSRNGRHVVSPQSGHWVNLDDPEIVVRAIKQVVEQTPRQTQQG